MARLPSHRFAAVIFTAAVSGMCVPVQAQDALAALGKERAARSPLAWDVGDTTHPTLGPIRFAMLKKPVNTAVGNGRVSSRAFVSCEKNARRIAIELANGRSPDDPDGLKPKTMPRLTCHRMAASGGPSPVADELEASWQVNELGDALTRGLRPARLRQCVAIGILQEVVMPPGSARGTARVELEIAPYDKALDDIFATCGEATAYAAASTPLPVANAPLTPAARVAAAPTTAVAAAPSSPRPAGGPWRPARNTPSGKTNVRAKPSIDSEVVTQLDAGAPIQVQMTGTEWWRVRPANGNAFEGYIRQDRLRFK